jgi:hypothetical protein
MHIARRVHYWLILLVLVLVPLQFLFVGYGLFGGDIDLHIAFGNLALHAGTLLIALSAAIGRLGWRQFIYAFVLFAGGFLQIMSVSIGQDNDASWIAAIHPLLAFLLWPYLYLLLLPTARAGVEGAATAGATAGT